MIAAIADTHTAIWHLFNDARLSLAAGGLIDRAAAEGQQIGVSAISLAEVVYLTEKGRLPAGAYEDLKNALADPEHVLTVIPVSIEIVETMPRVMQEAVPDMPDRIVAATGLYFGVPVISRDGRIRASNVQSAW